MPWTPLLPKKNAFDVVTISLTKAGGRFAPRLLVSIRTAGIPEMAWFDPNASVAVLEGHGDNAGELRIQPDGPWKLRSAVGRKVKGATAASLSLPAPAGAPAAGVKTMAVDFEYDAGWIEITVPTCFRPAKPVQMLTPPKPAHVSIMDRVEDDAVILQRRQGGRVR